MTSLSLFTVYFGPCFSNQNMEMKLSVKSSNVQQEIQTIKWQDLFSNSI